MIYDGCILVVGRIHQEGWFYFLFHSDKDSIFVSFNKKLRPPVLPSPPPYFNDGKNGFCASSLLIREGGGGGGRGAGGRGRFDCISHFILTKVVACPRRSVSW